MTNYDTNLSQMVEIRHLEQNFKIVIKRSKLVNKRPNTPSSRTWIFGLLNRRTGITRTAGSNPALSATLLKRSRLAA